MTAPLVRLRDPAGRRIRNPYRKFFTFLLLDGVKPAVGKARAKRRQARHLGDYHVVVVLGRLVADASPVVALGCRVPRCASHMLVHEDLVMSLPEDAHHDALRRLTASLYPAAEELAAYGAQSYLYSGEDPPSNLTERFRREVDAALNPTRGDSAAIGCQRQPAQEGWLVPPSGLPGDDPSDVVLWRKPEPRRSSPVAVLGAGDHAISEVIPALRRAKLDLFAVADREPHIAAQVAERYDFALASTSAMQVINELPSPGLVVVATAHDSHADLAAAALQADHRVFLEKPPVVTELDLRKLLDAAKQRPASLEIGFNRRWAPLVVSARRALALETGAVTFVATVKEIPLNVNHWYFWANQGGRITGNLCHWIDLAILFLPDSAKPERITLSPPPSYGDRLDEERVLTVAFNDGSVASIVATGRGDDTRGVQETVELRRGLTTVMIDDWRQLRVLKNGRVRQRRRLWRDKGHSRMYGEALSRLTRGKPAVYPLRDLVIGAVIQIEAARLMRERLTEAELGSVSESWLGALESGLPSGAAAETPESA